MENKNDSSIETNAYKKLNFFLKQIRTKTDFVPETAIVLGSGLGNFSNKIKQECTISYADIDGFPVSTNKMHAGRFIFGYIENKPIVLMDGRIHYYEGYTMEQVVTPIRIMKMLGAKNLILTNAAGGIDNGYKPGDLMIITDHITSFIPSPLIGPNIEELGVRFPDMTHVYSPELIDKLKSIGRDKQIDLKEGVYLQTTGPNYETPAEIRAYKALGANAVGMSTACEAMVATHCGMKICGLSCITNMAAGITGEPLDDSEVVEVASTVADKLETILYNLVKNL
jgi:purine-nucleoside phosphorylase